MMTVAIAVSSFVLYVVAYHTYGRYLARKVFRIEPERVPPSVEFEDGIDFVPSRRDLVFGHHFTSIAGTGPIVGPAVAVVWGWVPALVWVLIGSIVMGAVHDFGALVISMRHRGQTIGELAGDVINPRVRFLFLLVVLVGLWIVIAVFGLVIAVVFRLFPSSVLPVALQIPIAVGLGLYLRRGGSLLFGTLGAIVLMYGSIVVAANASWAQITIDLGWISPVAFWTLILLAYVFIASVLPVQTLLQPRDYINTHQLLIAMGLLLLGIAIAHPPIVATAVNMRPDAAVPGGHVPAFMPFLFVTIACGAISGFHCLVSSGCSSRQLLSEKDAQFVGYGAMLTEGFLATLVIIACVAGIGLGTTGGLTGREAWLHHYAVWGGSAGLGDKLAPFVTGSANMIQTIGLSEALATTIMGVFVASFAATTLDSATRLQRYVITELGGRSRASGSDRSGRMLLSNRYVATGIAVVTAGLLALSDAIARDASGAVTFSLAAAGTGGLILWPIFGATNQLLGGLALMVVTVWLVHHRRPYWVTAVPMVFMLAMTGWAVWDLLRGFAQPLLTDTEAPFKPHLLVVSGIMLALEVWIIIESVIVIRRPRQMDVSPE